MGGVAGRLVMVSGPNVPAVARLESDGTSARADLQRTTRGVADATAARADPVLAPGDPLAARPFDGTAQHLDRGGVEVARRGFEEAEERVPIAAMHQAERGMLGTRRWRGERIRVLPRLAGWN